VVKALILKVTHWFRIIIAALMFNAAFCFGGVASPLISEISDKKILIHSAFDGANLMLFGSRREAGEIVAVVRGENAKAVIHKKQQLYGVWVNKQREKFERLPIFYAIAASNKISEIENSVYLEKLGIGFNNIIKNIAKDNFGAITKQRGEFANALIHHLQLAKLYSSKVAKINFIGDGLFYVNIDFPDNTPTGTYSVEVYLIDDGVIHAMHTTSINVYKTGLDAAIFQLSQQNPWLYGLLAIGIAIFSGMLVAQLFDKRVRI
jgi:uncharacterized protein (TIGR02186 family)